jgi:hypothetical protein
MDNRTQEPTKQTQGSVLLITPTIASDQPGNQSSSSLVAMTNSRPLESAFQRHFASNRSGHSNNTASVSASAVPSETQTRQDLRMSSHDIAPDTASLATGNSSQVEASITMAVNHQKRLELLEKRFLEPPRNVNGSVICSLLLLYMIKCMHRIMF